VNFISREEGLQVRGTKAATRLSLLPLVRAAGRKTGLIVRGPSMVLSI